MELRRQHHTIVDALLRLRDCERLGARFVQRSGNATFYPYRDLLARAQAAAGSLQARGLRPGDRVGIILPTVVEFFDTFLGVILGGGIPTALYPPLRLGKLDEYFVRTGRMLQTIGARFLVSEPRIRRILGPAVEQAACISDVLDAGNLGPVGGWTKVEVDPDSPAFLQFSSGTTLDPKAVMVSHVNLISNLDMISSVFQTLSPGEIEQGCVCWLPLYHDMGLLGCMLMGLYFPGTVTYIGPEQFIARPRIWLETLSRYKGVVSPAPDFAYGLCAKLKDEDLEGLDLSNWKIALNGAEPIDIEVMESFCRRFGACGFQREVMTPAYGLSEAGLAVSFSPLGRGPRITEFDRERLSEQREAVPGKGRRLVSVGVPVPGIDLEIRDDRGNQVGEGRVGTIVVRGPSITRGYFNNPELSMRIIRDGWLDTGDLGFIQDRELYISGRAKDLVIVRGRNFAPQEIEHLLTGVRGLRSGCAVAVGAIIEGLGEQLVVLAEYDAASGAPMAEVEAEIADRVLTGLSLKPHDVRLLPPGTLPRTATEKLRRSEALRQYQTNTLAPPEHVNPLFLAKELGRSQIAWSRRWLRRAIHPGEGEES